MSSSGRKTGTGADIVEGLEELLMILSAMEVKASRTVLRGALRFGLTEIRKGMIKAGRKNLTGKRRKQISKLIGTAVGRNREHLIQAKAGYWIGAARKRKTKLNWWYGVLSSGTTQRLTRKTRQPTGMIVGDDHINRGYALSAYAAQGRISAKARELIDKEILKARQRSSDAA